MDTRTFTRRRFLRTTSSAAALGIPAAHAFAADARRVSIIIDPGDAVASAKPSRWAADELEKSLKTRGVTVHRGERVSQAPSGALIVLAAGAASETAVRILRSRGEHIPSAPEALALAQGASNGEPVALACGSDAAGLVYALLELADRVQHDEDPLSALHIAKPVAEQPANSIRGVNRLFTSDVEDKPWYNDRAMWLQYLTHLATQRFNRFSLSLGIGYDFVRNVTDAYFLFPYPFLIDAPGYSVRVTQLPDVERDRNLEMLKFISDEAATRGLHFQLGVWMHAYQWINSPNANYTIAGLTPETHGPYCRDALTALLKACPAISGVTFRIHGESGVEEGSYEFWRTVFDGVVRSGRKVEIDMHAKGMDEKMLEVALATGMPVTVSPKYWAEHMGMPYHQADIRELERPRPDRKPSSLMKLSAGSRSFLRYGYGDLLREDRRWGVLFRIWPGTQRLLLWGDPITGAAHSRAFGFCGADGVDIMEPLSFKGRRGSGIAGDRCAYADASLRPRWDWEKYRYSLRVWGRLLYNPGAGPDAWRRHLRRHLGSRASDIESALSNASRILPIITTAHGASAANNTYWPEMYTNQPIVDAGRANPYADTPAPKIFGNVSPFDPQLFLRVNDFAGELLAGEPSGKYSPVEVAQWLEDYADAAARHLAAAEKRASDGTGPEYRRIAADIAIQAGLGRFFAAKLRAGVLYGIFERTGDRSALTEALNAYRRARAAWADLATRAKIYQPDITVGEHPWLRGHWLDRLPAIDQDIADMAKRLEQTPSGAAPQDRARAAIRAALGRPIRPSLSVRHTPPARFHPGQPLQIEFSLESQQPASARLHYRHVNHAERFQTLDMEARDKRHRAVIPGPYTDSPYPLQYYFAVKFSNGAASLYPGFDANQANQPYFVVRRA